jgi:hypothetical protein
MSANHDKGGLDPKEAELMQRFIDQCNGAAKRSYSQGRAGADDDGDLAIAIRADLERQIVILSFGKNVEWIGLGPRDAVALAKMLIEKARSVSQEPLILTF